jgi:outer membrane protein
MKTQSFIPIVLLMLLCSPAFSQTNKGNLVLSGNTNLNVLFSNTSTGTDSIETGKIKNNQFAFTAAAGYFLIDNLNAGISATYAYDYTNSKPGPYGETSVGTITQTFTIMPQLNYYLPLQGKLKPFVGIGVGYLWLEQKDSRVSDNENKVYSMSGTSLSGGAGLAYFINQSVSFDLGFQYVHNRLKDKMNPQFIRKQNAVSGTLGVSVFF